MNRNETVKQSSYALSRNYSRSRKPKAVAARRNSAEMATNTDLQVLTPKKELISSPQTALKILDNNIDDQNEKKKDEEKPQVSNNKRQPVIIPDAKYSTLSDDGYISQNVSQFHDQEQPDRDMILKPL